MVSSGKHIAQTRTRFLFTHESHFCLQGSSDRRPVYRRRGERHSNNCIQLYSREYVIVRKRYGFSGISFSGGKDLVIFDCNMDALIMYMDLIVDHHNHFIILYMTRGAAHFTMFYDKLI